MKSDLRILLVALYLMTAGCKEEPPFINYQEKTSSFDTTYVGSDTSGAQLKSVLLEDISGVSCINCPDAAVKAHNLEVQHGERLNVYVIQPFLQDLVTRPNHDTRNDNRTQEGTVIVQTIGEPGSLPRGYVDRKVYAGNPDPIVDRFEWSAKVAQQLSLATPVNIEATAVLDPAGRKLSVEITLRYTQPSNDSHYVSIALLEDSIIDAQEYPSYIEPNYVHMHLLRKMITAPTGDALNGSLVAGRVFRKRYDKYIIPANFNEKHLKVLVFVHKDPSKKEVLHSRKFKVL